MSTRQVQVQRATRGKVLRFRFGASIHHVVGLDLSDDVFEPDSTEMRPQWKPRIDKLLEQLKKGPATLRLSYIADVEDKPLVDERLAAVKAEIIEAWEGLDGATSSRSSRRCSGVAAVRRRSETPRRSWKTGESMLKHTHLPLLWALLAAPLIAQAQETNDAPPGEASERQLPTDEPFMQWSRDPRAARNRGRGPAGAARSPRRAREDREAQERRSADPVRVGRGGHPGELHREAAQRCSPGCASSRTSGCTSSATPTPSPCRSGSPGSTATTQGLSRERAGEVAEFLQKALELPPEAISFEWAGDTQPIAANDTDEGRARNRRVEVEVWYDESETGPKVEDVVVPGEIKQVKVCRMEKVCKLRYREGEARRARVKNLVAPLHFDGEMVNVSEGFVRQVGQALANLQTKQNVTVKFIGFTDDAALSGRAERIYGTQAALSKAMAYRVALAMKDALDLPTAAIASDGRGATQPLASNETARGRALNRRVEVEFWYDDPLQELPDEPQLCPDAAGAEVVTKVYDPPAGAVCVAADRSRSGRDPAGLHRPAARAPWNRSTTRPTCGCASSATRAASASTGAPRWCTETTSGCPPRARAARWRRSRSELALSDAQVEHEGRGYVHSDDVVNSGFVAGRDLRRAGRGRLRRPRGARRLRRRRRHAAHARDHARRTRSG